MKIDQESLASKIKATAEEIAFGDILTSTFRAATHHVMRIFDELGRSLGYEVEIGWLYDMTWYVEEGRVMSDLPMVLECEWNRLPRHRDEINSDFQKLVQARADVRVWISASPDAASTHIENCERQIRLFSGSLPGDRYIFAVYDWTTGKPIIKQLVLPQSN